VGGQVVVDESHRHSEFPGRRELLSEMRVRSTRVQRIGREKKHTSSLHDSLNASRPSNAKTLLVRACGGIADINEPVLRRVRVGGCGQLGGMRRGLLQDYANQVCQMAVGWRLTIVDLPLLLERGKGTVTFDLLTCTAALDGAPMSLTIMSEVRAWLDEAKLRDGLPDNLITQFTMRMHFDLTEETAGRLEQRSVELECHSEMFAADAQYRGSARKRELWSRTKPETVWIIRDA
jgi:hypothetical protein